MASRNVDPEALLGSLFVLVPPGRMIEALFDRDGYNPEVRRRRLRADDMPTPRRANALPVLVAESLKRLGHGAASERRVDCSVRR